MKLSYALLVMFITIMSGYAQKSPQGDIWLHMLSTGQPAAQRYLGDQLNSGSTWYINFEIGQASWNQSDAGIGTSNTDPSLWTWRSATWYNNGSGSNKQVHADFGDFRFTSTGNWYFAGRAKADAGDPWHYANTDGWANASTFSPIYYFSVSALNNPSSQTANLNGTNPTSQIDLSWAKDAQNHNVMIVRKKSTDSWTEPVQGTTYAVGASIGSGTVVYNSNGTNFSNTGLNSSTGYDYKFYSENWSYYSAGVTTSTVYTSTAASDYFRSKVNGNWNSAGTWESSFDNSTWINATSSPTGYANTTLIRASHTVTVSSTEAVNAMTIESGAQLKISTGQGLTVNGILTNSGSASGLVVESDGSLITNGSISGTATVKREIASDNKWHFISSPVTGQSICDGTFAPLTSNFNATTGGTYDFYKWSEPSVSGNLNWLNLKNSDWTLNTVNFGSNPQFDAKQGYLVAYSSSFGGSTTKAFAGNLISGDQTVTLGNTGTTWNLVGNPFASAVNWDGVDKSNLDGGYYYVYNEAKSGGAGYESYLDATHSTSGANGKISSTQGFFVKASGTSLVLPNSARVHNTNWMKNSDNKSVEKMVVRLSQSSYYDESYLIFEEQGNSGSDFYDAFKLMSLDPQVPQVYSLLEPGVNLAINSMPFSLDNFDVQLGAYFPVNCNYTLEVGGLESFPVTPDVVLEDLQTGTLTDMITSPVYSFQAAANEEPNRFILHFGGITGMRTMEANTDLKAFAEQGSIKVRYNGKTKGQLVVTDIAGRSLYRSSITPGYEQRIDVKGTTGLYFVRLENSAGSTVKKVLVN